MGETRGGTRWARNARIAILLGVLAVVVLYALVDVRRRRERNSWRRSLEVAVVLVERGPVDPAAVSELRERAHALERRLGEERARYGSGPPPFRFQLFGPVPSSESPPTPASDGLLDLASHAWHSRRYFESVDERANVPSRAFDSRVYLIVRPPADAERTSVEGQSEQGGRIGSVEVELDETMVDLALFVATHELFHTLGASDKYDDRGFALAPQGLAEPDRQPLYPQAAAEVMARNVALAPDRERPPDSLEELRVGAATATEIGWLMAP